MTDMTDELERLNAGRTQGVWRLHRLTDGTLVVVDGEDPQRVVASGRTPQDAALIVAAVNALPELVAMARRVAELESIVLGLRATDHITDSQAYADAMNDLMDKACAYEARAALKGT